MADHRIEILGGCRVKSRDRLVQDQELIRSAEGPRDQGTLFLSAGEIPVAALFEIRDSELFHIDCRKLPLFHRVKRSVSTLSKAAGDHDLLYRRREILLGRGLLREISDSGPSQLVRQRQDTAGGLYES